jgi:hypothetical protein
MPRTTAAAALAGGILLLFAAVVLGAFVTGDRDLARALGQGLLNVLVGVAGYYFGSSAGSARKDQTIAKALHGENERG